MHHLEKITASTWKAANSSAILDDYQGLLAKGISWDLNNHCCDVLPPLHVLAGSLSQKAQSVIRAS